MTDSTDPGHHPRDEEIDRIEPNHDERLPATISGDDWTLWPPSPKMQIALIAIGFGLFNFMLLAIWAWVMIREFG
ncbi:MAG TPA: hypothetical protein VD767_11550 [Thermomicrobiales bacterium]|nr:hypothetical protein [Thermomicrobiales bacterium]